MPYTTINGFQMYYESCGEGEPLLFIHGLGAGVWTWEAQINHLKQYYKIFCPELRGHGRSDKPAGDYSIELFAQDLAEFIQTEQLGKVHLIGLSMGGIIAFQLACDYPELCQSLVVVNTGPEAQLDSLAIRSIMLQRDWFTTQFSMKAISSILAQKLFPEENQEALREKFIREWSKNDKTAYQKAFRAMLHWNSSRHNPRKVKCPALFVTTEQDYTSIQAKKRYIYRMRDARLALVANSRHVTPLDQPEALNAVLEDFLGDLD